MKLDVCICTHNPRRDILRRVLEALAQQNLRKERFHVWFIDNASVPPISLAELAVLSQAGVGFTMLPEPRPGQIFARARAIEASSGPWMVFVDDDTVLATDYLERVAEIAAEHPELGCFGGKLLLPEGLPVPNWARAMLPYIAIKECGEEPITRNANEWGLWEPPGGGAAVCRDVLELYVRRLAENPEIARLGRKGERGLFSCDDSLMMRGAYTLGLGCSYQPRLRLEHHLAPHRLKFFYLARLLYALGRSRVVLERALGGTVPAMSSAEGRRLRRETWRLLRRLPWNRVQLCQQAQQWGYFLESRAREQPSVAAYMERTLRATPPYEPGRPIPPHPYRCPQGEGNPQALELPRAQGCNARSRSGKSHPDSLPLERGEGESLAEETAPVGFMVPVRGQRKIHKSNARAA